jgi:V/A-type H+-transporting ATPase subunit D
MAKVKLTKGELKRQRDNLKQYQRFLPTLQLKKQQLQLEILQQLNLLGEKKKNFLAKKEAALSWAGLLSEESAGIKKLLGFDKIIRTTKNIGAGRGDQNH